MIAKVLFEKEDKSMVEMLFGTSHKGSWQKFYRMYTTKFPHLKPLSLSISQEEWPVEGGFNWCPTAIIQQELNTLSEKYKLRTRTFYKFIFKTLSVDYLNRLP